MLMYIPILEYNHTEVQLQNRHTFKTLHTLSHAVITRKSYLTYRMFSFKHNCQ